MDPITLAVVTSGLTLVASECAKGAASEAGKDIWNRAKALLGFTDDQKTDSNEVAKIIASKLASDSNLLQSAQLLLNESKSTDWSAQSAHTIATNVEGENVAVGNYFKEVNFNKK